MLFAHKTKERSQHYWDSLHGSPSPGASLVIAVLILVSPMWLPHWVTIRALLKDQEKVKTATIWCIWDWTRVKERWKVSDPRLCSPHLSQTLTCSHLCSSVWPICRDSYSPLTRIMNNVTITQHQVLCLVPSKTKIPKQVFVNSCSAPCFQKGKGERSRLSLL